MRAALNIIKAEMIKTYKNTFPSKMAVFPALLWPVMMLLIAYYSFHPFDMEGVQLPYGIDSSRMLLIFLLTGAMAYNTFWSMVTSAWSTSRERQSGVLEMIFLSPANRFAIVYGRSLGSLIMDMWMFFTFSIVVLIIVGHFSVSNILWLVLAYVILIVCATIWGGLMNALFLLSRDADYLFSVFGSPMTFFSGVNVPVSTFPLWARIISHIFPLTYCLIIIRHIFMNDFDSISGLQVILLVMILVVLVLLTRLILYIGERNNRRTGNLILY